ncbi:MAG: HAD family hydrolase [Desulfotomaculales bacterium]
MLTVNIPGRGTMTFEHIVLDFNGTMARDGVLLPGVKEKLNLLAESLNIHILTADTFGTGKEACREIKGSTHILEQGKEGGPLKKEFVKALGKEKTIAVGNGTNDVQMLREAALGIVVLGPEGTSAKALEAADVVVKDICDGLDLLLNTKRLIATLRS